MNLAWLKTHKYYVLGGAVGLLVLVYIVKHMQAASSAGTGAGASTDLSSPGSSGVTSYDAAASVQNAQVNGQVEIAQVQAGVASQQVSAQVQINKDTTTAELAASLAKTSSDTAIALGGEQAAVESQRIVTSGQVQQTRIVGNTLDTLGAQHEAVLMAQTDIVGAQVKQIQEHSKHASQDYAAIAPILAIETGQPGAAVGTANANATGKVAAAGTAQTAIKVGSSVLTDLIGGLFGGA